MTSLLARVARFFVEPPTSPPPASPASLASRRAPSFLPPSAAPEAPGAGSDVPTSSGTAGAAAAVLGSPAAVVPVAAACAGELRARSRAGAALLCIWRPAGRPAPAEPDGAVPASASPTGATTPGARRVAARLVAHDLPATACGRLAWLALERDPAAAEGQLRRCMAIADVPVVLAVAGPRPPAFEPLLAELDLALAVLAPDADPALRDVALATLRARERAVVAPLPPGPPRWAAMAGLARLRSLPRSAP